MEGGHHALVHGLTVQTHGAVVQGPQSSKPNQGVDVDEAGSVQEDPE